MVMQKALQHFGHFRHALPADPVSKKAPRQKFGRRILSRFTKDQRGVTAVEFGMLAVPFFAIIGATLETAFMLLVSQILENGVQDAGRTIRTGQAQAAGATISSFRAELCDNTVGLFDCSKFHISVKTIANFASASYTAPIYDPTEGVEDWTDPEVYVNGGGGCVVLINVHYRWPALTSLMGFSLADVPDSGVRLLSGVSIFRNEPFSSGCP